MSCPWKCCNVCSKDSSCLLITRPCAHLICNSCKERRNTSDCCPVCNKGPVVYQDTASDSIKPLLADVKDSAVHLQKTLVLQYSHYQQSCTTETDVLSGAANQDVSLPKLEKETLQFESRTRQMYQWKASHVPLFEQGEKVLAHLVNFYQRY